MDIDIRPTSEADVPLILTFIRELADCERLSHEVVATEEALRDSLFGEPSFPEVLYSDKEAGARPPSRSFFSPGLRINVAHARSGEGASPKWVISS